jgi:hypothetical protein
MKQNGLIDVRVIHSYGYGRLTAVKFNRHNRGMKRYHPSHSSLARLHKVIENTKCKVVLKFDTHLVEFLVVFE